VPGEHDIANPGVPLTVQTPPKAGVTRPIGAVVVDPTVGPNKVSVMLDV
jgi:hypothetical protein